MLGSKDPYIRGNAAKDILIAPITFKSGAKNRQPQVNCSFLTQDLRIQAGLTKCDFATPCMISLPTATRLPAFAEKF